MYFFFPLLAGSLVQTFDTKMDIFFNAIEESVNIFQVMPTEQNSNIRSFIIFYQIEDTDIVKVSRKQFANTDIESDWETISVEDATKPISSNGPLKVWVKPSFKHHVLLRGGYVNPEFCPNGVIFASKNFNLEERMQSAGIQYPHTFCALFPYYEFTVTLKNTLTEADTFKYMSAANVLSELTVNQQIEGFSKSEFPLLVVIKIASKTPPRSLRFNVQGEEISGSDPEESAESSQPVPSTPKTDQPKDRNKTPERTPEESWDGVWLDPPNVIVRGEDVPEIKETHLPIQTNYVKKEITRVQKAVNIGIGGVFIIITVILGIINIARTYHKLKYDEYEFSDSNFESDLDLSSSILYETISTSEEQKDKLYP